MSDLGDDIISISDEEGNEYELLVLDEAIMDDSRYLLLTDAMDFDENDNANVEILKVITDEATGEELLSTVEDEAELEAIYRLFEDRMFSEDEDYEEDEDGVEE